MSGKKLDYTCRVGPIRDFEMIARRMGISRSACWQLEKRALKKIRLALEDDPVLRQGLLDHMGWVEEE